VSGALSLSSDLLTLFGSGGAGSTAVGDPILNALYGTATATGDPVQALQTAERNQTQDVALTAQQPAVARDIAHFESAVQSATSPAQLLADPTVMKVLLTASGMSDQVGYTALATQALLSNASDPKALVNQLTDTRWLTVNQTYDFATKGLSVIQSPKVLADIASGYAEQSWYQTLDAGTPGLAEALQFKAQAASITSVGQILGNPLFFNVVTTALGIPIEIAFQDQHAQEQAIGAQLDVAQLGNANYVNGITDRYLIAMQQQSGGAQSAPTLASLAVQAGGLVA
jgi:hypothetical protein